MNSGGVFMLKESDKNKIIHDIYRRRQQRGVISEEQLNHINEFASNVAPNCECKGDLVKLIESHCIKNDIPIHKFINRRYHPVNINLYEDTFGVIANNTGNEFIFDMEFLALLEGKGWNEDRIGYLKRENSSNDLKTTIYAHHLVTGKPKKRTWHTDHIDGNKRNNRKNNLRIIPASLNCANSKINYNSTSGFKGVSFHKAEKKWCGYIMKDREVYNLGYYDTARDAATAYDIFAKFLFGDYALTNHKQGLL